MSEPKLDEFTQAYIAAALWSTPGPTNEEGDAIGSEYLDGDYTFEDIAPATLQEIIKDCAKFQAENAADIEDREADAGHDFWLTRNGHGAGFWDGDWPEAGDRLTKAAKEFGEVDLYVGDDGKLYS